jgi:DnaJ family protein A protein 2
MDAVEGGGGGGGGGGGADILSQMFGMGGGGRRDTGPAKGEDQQHPLKCTLEDLYNGRTRKMKLNKLERCATCSGSGCKDGKQRTKCAGCNGQGVKIIRRQIGPGMVQQMQARCPDCGGEGVMVKEEDKCRPCRGTGAEKKEKILSVVTDKGMRHGDKVYFRGEGDYEAGKIPGDIIFVVQQQEHDRFIRKGDDLLTEKTITLAQALCGMEVVIKHLDIKEDESSRHLVVRTRAGHEVIKPGDVRVISEEGMPQHKNPFVKGNMYIRFKVDFPLPSQIRGGAAGIQELLKVLPPIPSAAVPAEAEEVIMTVGDLEQLGANSRSGHGRGATEEDDEDDGSRGGQRVQCANQ